MIPVNNNHCIHTHHLVIGRHAYFAYQRRRNGSINSQHNSNCFYHNMTSHRYYTTAYLVLCRDSMHIVV